MKYTQAELDRHVQGVAMVMAEQLARPMAVIRKIVAANVLPLTLQEDDEEVVVKSLRTTAFTLTKDEANYLRFYMKADPTNPPT